MHFYEIFPPHPDDKFQFSLTYVHVEAKVRKIEFKYSVEEKLQALKDYSNVNFNDPITHDL